MDNSYNKNIILFFVFLGFSLIFLLLDHFLLLNWFKGRLEKILNPPKLAMFNFKKISYLTQKNYDLAIFEAKINFLEAENAVLQAQLKTLSEENEALRKELKASPAAKVNLLPARNLTVIEGIMTLDKGQKDGLEENQIVVSENILVGKITKVNPYTSRVELPVKEGNTIKVKILPINEEGILKGSPENRLFLEEVLQKADLQEGQIVVTSGKEGVYPAGLPVARIETVLEDDIQFYKKAEVKPLLDYEKLNLVMVRI